MFLCDDGADVTLTHSLLRWRQMGIRDRSISGPLAWYPRLLHATSQERVNWEIAGAGYGIYWPDIDEDLSVEGLLRGAPAPQVKTLIS